MKTNNRFALCILKYLSDNRNAYIMGFSAFLGFWFIIGVLLGIFETGGGPGEWSFYWLTCFLCSQIFASLMFSDMKTKEGRINMLMQPASTADKYWPRFISGILIPVIPMVAGYYTLELGRLIANLIIIGKWLPLMQPWEPVSGMSTLGWVASVTFFLSVQSYYFFGAILWPKHSFLKTMASMIIIQVLIMGLWTAFWKFVTPYYIIDIDDDYILGIFITIGALITLLFSWLSFRRLNRCTVVYRLFQ